MQTGAIALINNTLSKCSLFEKYFCNIQFATDAEIIDLTKRNIRAITVTREDGNSGGGGDSYSGFRFLFTSTCKNLA